MKSICVRNFRNNIAKHLDDLPLGLTRYGKIIAVIHPVDGVTPQKDSGDIPTDDELEKMKEEALG